MTAPQKFGDAIELIHEHASALTGSDDFGPKDYLPGLRIILRSADCDVRFTPGGRELAWRILRDVLAARAYAVKMWAEHPAALTEPIIQPLVITGIPRTGTTALHKLLATDPQFQGLENWLMLSPMPRPPRDQWSNYPAYERAHEFLETTFGLVPAKRTSHNVVADEVDECLEVLRQSFVSNRWACTWKAPSYDAWWQTQNEQLAYEWYANVLRLIGHGYAEKRWLLKNPGHVANLDLLFRVFPDACVVQTHRNPIYAIPSISNGIRLSHRVYEGDQADDFATLIGPREMEKWAHALSRAKPVRESHRRQIFDIDHSRFTREPMVVIREIYRHFDLHLTESTERSMIARTVAKPERKYGEHRYDVNDLGLITGEIEERFMGYIEEFDLTHSD